MRLLFTSSLLLLAWCLSPSRCGVLIEPTEVEMLLDNQRLLNNMVKCLLDEGPCTRQGKEIKKNLPTSLRSGCAKCDEKQKSATEKLLRRLKEKFPQEWGKLLSKYDPDGSLRGKNQWLGQFL